MKPQVGEVPKGPERSGNQRCRPQEGSAPGPQTAREHARWEANVWNGRKERSQGPTLYRELSWDLSWPTAHNSPLANVA